MRMELEPTEIFEIVKKNKHCYSIASEPFTSMNRDFIVYNISLKKDYSDEFEYVNCRRGLTYIHEIINFQNQNFDIARKGMPKFKDLMPEYLDMKESHIKTSKYH
jgi:hypothetical protein